MIFSSLEERKRAALDVLIERCHDIDAAVLLY